MSCCSLAAQSQVHHQHALLGKLNVCLSHLGNSLHYMAKPSALSETEATLSELLVTGVDRCPGASASKLPLQPCLHQLSLAA